MAMKSSVLVSKVIDIAKNYKTLYVMGCFGAPLTGKNVTRYLSNNQYNMQSSRQKMIKNAANQNPPVYGFDCVNLIKGVVWGWCGDPNKTYGGAGYKINGCADYSANTLINACPGATTNFNNIVPGEVLWMSGHVGVYIGDGLCVECTPSFDNKVQITAVTNIAKKPGYNSRKWTKHAKMPFIDYSDQPTTSTPTASTPAVTKPTTSTGGFKVGDVVNFVGNKHYTSSNSTTPKSCKPGKAKVNQTYNGRHPYQLIRVAGGGSTVYGWVDAADIQGATNGTSVSYNIKIYNCTALNIRSEPSTDGGKKTIVGCIRDSAKHAIVEEKNGWGRLGDGRGWISLTYTKKV